MSSPSPIVGAGSSRIDRTKTTTLVSPFDRAECIRRLVASVDPWWRFGGKPSPVIGNATGAGISLRRRSARWNPFNVAASLRFADDGPRTRITCDFGIGTGAAIFGLAWFAVLVWAEFDIATSSREYLTDADLLFALVPAFGIAFLIGLLIAGHLRAQANRDFIVGFVQETLSANEASRI